MPCKFGQQVQTGLCARFVEHDLLAPQPRGYPDLPRGSDLCGLGHNLTDGISCRSALITGVPFVHLPEEMALSETMGTVRLEQAGCGECIHSVSNRFHPSPTMHSKGTQYVWHYFVQKGLLDMIFRRLWKTFNITRTLQKQKCNLWEVNTESEYLKFDAVM